MHTYIHLHACRAPFFARSVLVHAVSVGLLKAKSDPKASRTLLLLFCCAG